MIFTKDNTKCTREIDINNHDKKKEIHEVVWEEEDKPLHILRECVYLQPDFYHQFRHPDVMGRELL
jgi:hypothetical protein